MSQQITPLKEILYGAEKQQRIKELVSANIENIKATPSVSLQQIQKQLLMYDDPRLKMFEVEVKRERKIKRIIELTFTQWLKGNQKERGQVLIQIYQLRDPRLNQQQETFEQAFDLMGFIRKKHKNKFLEKFSSSLWGSPWNSYKYFIPAPPKKQEQNITVSQSEDEEFDTTVSCQGKYGKKKIE